MFKKIVILTTLMLLHGLNVYAVNFNSDGKIEPVAFTTVAGKQGMLRNWEPRDIESYGDITTNGDNMTLYQTGVPFDGARVVARSKVFDERSARSTPGPMTLVIEYEGKAVAFVTIGNGYDSGQASMALVSDASVRKLGIANAVVPLIREVLDGLHVQKATFSGAPLEYVHASCRYFEPVDTSLLADAGRAMIKF